MSLSVLSLIFSLGIYLIWRWSKKTIVLGKYYNGRQDSINKDFTYPHITPDTRFDINSTPAIPYRPFRWGPTYAVTMGIRNMDFDNWIELDSRFPAYHKIRSHRMNVFGEESYRILEATTNAPGGEYAAKELAHELSEFLSRKFPQMYRVTRKIPRPDDFGWYNQGEIKSIEIIPLNVTYDLDVDNPMMISGLLVQDDIAVMLEGRNGMYYFQAGAVCTAGFWRLRDKIGLPLEEIHLSGHVPQYKEKLQTSLNRFFSKLKVDRPILRNNFFFQVIRDIPEEERSQLVDPEELSWSDTTNGPEDAWDHRNQRADVTIDHAPIKNIRFRTERQSLRRLPRSGAIIFTVRTYLESIIEISKEPGVPGRLASAIRSMSEDILNYKGAHLWKESILPYLDERHQEQTSAGVVCELDREHKYPY